MSDEIGREVFLRRAPKRGLGASPAVPQSMVHSSKHHYQILGEVARIGTLTPFTPLSSPLAFRMPDKVHHFRLRGRRGVYLRVCDRVSLDALVLGK